MSTAIVMMTTTIMVMMSTTIVMMMSTAVMVVMMIIRIIVISRYATSRCYVSTGINATSRLTV